MNTLNDRVRAALGEIMADAPIPGRSPNPVYFDRVAPHRPTRTLAITLAAAAAVSVGLISIAVSHRNPQVPAETQAPSSLATAPTTDAAPGVPTPSTVPVPDSTQPATDRAFRRRGRAPQFELHLRAIAVSPDPNRLMTCLQRCGHAWSPVIASCLNRRDEHVCLEATLVAVIRRWVWWPGGCNSTASGPSQPLVRIRRRGWCCCASHRPTGSRAPRDAHRTR